MNKVIQQLKELTEKSNTVLVLQPEKPDGDSLSSALALEQILGDQGKQVIMYCQDPIPEYIRVLGAWDRVTDRFPAQFDLTIMVDAGSAQMIERTLAKHGKPLSQKPFVIIDHHRERTALPFATIDIIDPQCAANTQLIYNLAQQLDWPVSPEAAELLMEGILSDTRGFRNSNTDAAVLGVASELAAIGVSLAELYQRHTEADSLTPDLLRFKGQLLQRIEYHADGKIALVVVTPSELAVYADLHDPADLVNTEMREARGVVIAIIIRDYGTKIKVSTRANTDIAAAVCAHFGGGGHPRAAGFRSDGKPVDELKAELIKVASALIKEHEAN